LFPDSAFSDQSKLTFKTAKEPSLVRRGFPNTYANYPDAALPLELAGRE
jgi:hypothetical protein